MLVLSNQVEEDTEDANDESAIEYVDTDSDYDPDYDPEDYDRQDCGLDSDDSLESDSSASMQEPMAKRRRLGSLPTDDTLHFYTHKGLTDIDTCRWWVLLFCQLLPGLENVSTQFLTGEVGLPFIRLVAL